MFRYTRRICAIVLVVVAIVFVFMRIITPKINQELSHVGSVLAEKLGLPIEIKKTHFGWSGGYFVIHFDDLQVFDEKKEKPLLQIEQADLRLKPIASLLARQLIVKELAVSGLDLLIIQHPNAPLTLDWTALWARFPIEILTVQHTLLRIMTPDHFLYKIINVSAVFERAPEGLTKAYITLSNLDVKPFKLSWLPEGTVTAQVWLDLQNNAITQASAEFEAQNLLLPAPIQHIKGQLHWVQLEPERTQWVANNVVLTGDQLTGTIAYATFTPEPFSLLVDLKNVSIPKTSTMPGFSGLDLIVSADNHTGSAFLTGKNIYLTYDSVKGSDRHVMTDFRGMTNWWKESDSWSVENQWDFQQEKEPVSVIWKASVENKTPMMLEAVVTAPTLSAVSISQGFPKAILNSKEVGDWLKQSITAGTLQDTVMVFRGPVKDGMFQAITQVQEGVLKFHPKWPPLKHIHAALTFDKHSFKGQTTAATIDHATIHALTATIPHFDAPILTLNTTLSNDFLGDKQTVSIVKDLNTDNDDWLILNDDLHIQVKTLESESITAVAIQSKALTGKLTFETKKYPEPNVLTGSLQSLIIPETIFSNPLTQKTLQTIQWPMVQGTIEQLSTKTANVKNLVVHLVPTKQGYTIETLNGHSDQMTFKTHGSWHFLNEQQPMILQGVCNTKNIGHALQTLGFDTNLKEAEAEVTFDLKWQGSLFDHLATLNGQAAFTMKNGRILGVSPGLGRVLSLFNIDNVRRRLQLDFSDLYKSGFSFDTLEGTLLAANSQITTDNLKIKGPVAEIHGNGQVSLSTQEVDAHLKVFPKVTGTLPMAAALAAGNPAIGAAIWVFDKLVNRQKPIQSYEYQLTGTWTDPIVTDTQKNKLKLSGQLGR